MSFKMYTVILAMIAGTAFAYPSRNCSSTPTPTCQEPPNQTTGYPDYDLFCHCSPYTKQTSWGNPYLGLVTCDTKCTPKNPTQREAHNDKADSLSTCMNACTGSFEKAKRQSDDDYWFCHGVNFVEGQLCEFIGSLGEKTLASGSGNNCFYIDGLDPQ
ncbi:hypothetical protein GGR51DRAFT_398377 [Nemania sp. FL0031]|nr:hypothetical protein GGR51DRAFT_398377 [Nemania sp. FL0031]